MIHSQFAHLLLFILNLLFWAHAALQVSWQGEGQGGFTEAFFIDCFLVNPVSFYWRVLMLTNLNSSFATQYVKDATC